MANKTAEQQTEQVGVNLQLAAQYFAGCDEPAMCTGCMVGGFGEGELEGGICPDCAKAPAICVGCKWETTRAELNEDLLCTGCESGARAEAA